MFVDLHKSALELPRAAGKKRKEFIFYKRRKTGVFFRGGAWTGTYMYFILHDPDDPAIDEFFLSPVRQKSACLLVNIQ